MQGPEKSWNLLGSDVDADAKICGVRTPLFCVRTVFFATFSQHVTVMNIYSSTGAAIIYIWLVTADCLYN